MLDVIASRPDKKDHGSCPPWKLKHLYEMGSRVNPKIIAESGTWKGNSLWLFRKAFPDATIYSFDIDYSNLMWKDESIIYNEFDITKSDIPTPDFIFFYDHINQYERLKWAKENGCKHIVFDDNIPVDKLHLFGMPPVPTLQMIELPEYVKEYKILDYDGSDTKARNGGQSYLTYVRL